MSENDSIFEMLRSDWPDDRPSETLPSRVTSVDIKLCFNHARDTFIAVVLGDINANPGGIRDRSTKETIDIAERVSEAFISNLDGDSLGVAVVLPSNVYDDAAKKWRLPRSWYTQDRKSIVESVESLQAVSSTSLVSDCSRLDVTSGQLFVEQDGTSLAVDGYVNLDDTDIALSRALDDDIGLFSSGANAPTAVWNPRFDKSGKVGLLDIATELAEQTEGIKCPRFSRVESLSELNSFRKGVGDIVLKGPFGTHGDEVVSIRRSEDPTKQFHAVTRGRKHDPEKRDFTIYDETADRFVFNARGWESGYGLAEEAITGTFRRDGETIETLEVDGTSGVHPIDFVPLVLCRQNGIPEVPSVMVRASKTTDLNANRHAGSMTLETLETAFNDGVTIQTDGRNDRNIRLQDLAEKIAKRPVSFEELRRPLFRAGRLALVVRNRAALQIEQTL